MNLQLIGKSVFFSFIIHQTTTQRAYIQDNRQTNYSSPWKYLVETHGRGFIL